MGTSKLKLFKMNSCSSRSIKSLNINILLDSLCRSFSTLIESPKTDDPIEVTESPELPIWVRISENDTTIKKTPEDDFVLPSLSYWMENYKQGESKGHDKITVLYLILAMNLRWWTLVLVVSGVDHNNDGGGG
ncbi:hypothetical protein L1887_18403 [Cichorium endivia]|nr:hypothetical protein L1887_18403 [Cichorium endivia]